MHLQTLVILAFLLGVLVSVVLIVVWRFNRTVPGMKLWAWTFPCITMFSMALLLREAMPETLSVLMAQLGVFIASWLSWQAAREYVGWRALPLRTAVLALMLVLGGAMFFTHVEPHHFVRFVLIGLSVGASYLLAAHTLLYRCPQRQSARWWLGLVLLVHGAFVLLRPVIFGLLEGDADWLRTTSSVSQLIVLEAILSLILIGFSVLMLINETTTRELRLLADVDPLTNVSNRRAFLALLDKAIVRSSTSLKPLSVLVIDLDHFKNINDTWGHRSGDEVLRHFAILAGTCLRQGDVFGRLGGEEFAIALPNADGEGALLVAERLRITVHSHPLQCEGGRSIALTASIGVSLRLANDTADSLLQRADEAMYMAKQRGRNRVEMTMPDNRNLTAAMV